MIVLDTTVLAYAVGGDHPLRAPCRSIFDAATGGHIDARTTTFVIQEFAHVRARRHGRAEAARRARTFAEILHPLLATEEEHLDHALASSSATTSSGLSTRSSQ